MTRLYLVLGILICGVFAYACWTGWNVIDPFATAPNRPKGASMYHK